MCPVRHSLNKDRAAVGCVLLAAALLAVGYTQTPAVTRDPVTLRFGVASPKTALTSSGVRGFIGNLLSESLIGMGWDGRRTRVSRRQLSRRMA